MIKPLDIIGNITVSPEVMSHRFAVEALEIAKLLAEKIEEGESKEPVVGTRNTRQVELYGWAPNVGYHVDKTGYIYLVPLNEGRSTLNIFVEQQIESVRLPMGAVVRLDDRFIHWTEDQAPRICAFIGSFNTPCDQDALSALESAIQALGRGDYYGAPRVAAGFRLPLKDECIVANEAIDDTEIMLLADAKAQNRFIQTCAQCERPAVRLDDKWPYHTEMNRCIKHMKGA